MAHARHRRSQDAVRRQSARTAFRALALALLAAAARAGDAGEGVLVLRLDGVGAAGEQHLCWVDQRDGQPRVAVAPARMTAPRATLDGSDLRRAQDGTIAGTLRLQLAGASGKPIATTCTVSARLDGRSVRGSWQGARGGAAAGGSVRGEIVARRDAAAAPAIDLWIAGAAPAGDRKADDEDTRLHLALRRIDGSWRLAAGPGTLIVRFKEAVIPDAAGATGALRLWSSSPWRSARVAEQSVRVAADAIEGSAVIALDAGAAGAASSCTIAWSAQVVGDAVVGSAQATTSGQERAGLLVLGTLAQPIAVAAATSTLPAAEAAGGDPALAAAAAAEMARPIRPGAPGGAPFWTSRWHGARRYIAPPAFDIAAVDGASSYRLRVVAAGRGASPTVHAEATTARPWEPLTALWERVPIGAPVALEVEALDAAGRPIAAAQAGAAAQPGRIVFTRAVPFPGPLLAPTRAQPERLLRLLRAISAGYACSALAADAPAAACAIPGGAKTDDVAQSGYQVAGAMALLARRSDDRDEAQRARMTAVRAGEWLRDTCSGPYFLTPYHWGQQYSALDAGHAWLDLRAATGEDHWLDLARRMADGLRRSQRPSGSWSWMGRDGKPWAGGSAGPMYAEFDAGPFLDLLGRLRAEAGCAEFADVERRAFAWMQEDSLRSFHWRGMIFHVSQHHQMNAQADPGPATRFCLHLLAQREATPAETETAAEIMRWVEDQFIDWTHRVDGVARPRVTSKDGDVGIVARCAEIWARLHRRTGDPLHRAKAQALVDGIWASQDPVGGALVWRTPAHPFDGYGAAEAAVRLATIAELLAAPATR